MGGNCQRMRREICLGLSEKMLFSDDDGGETWSISHGSEF